MYRVPRFASLAARPRTGSSTSGRVVAVHNGHEGRVQLTEFRALDPKCTPVAEALCAPLRINKFIKIDAWVRG